MEQIPLGIHDSWKEHLEPLFQDPKILELKYNILPTENSYPKPENIFKVFEMPLWAIKVVILGQDPYYNFGLATGLAFAVPQHFKTPLSLRVIQRELINEGLIPSEDDKDYQFDKTLISWFHQGVFLLNTALTVKANEPNSHKEYWQNFIEGVINIIAEHAKPIWLLWGSNARELGQLVFNHHQDGRPVGHRLNRTMSCTHPATEAPNRGGGFYGCDHFKKVNRLLLDNGEQRINW